GGGSIVRDTLERRLALGIVEVEAAHADLVDLEHEGAQRVFLRNPGGEEQVGKEGRTLHAVRQLAFGTELNRRGRKGRRLLRGGAEEAQRVRIGRRRRKAVARTLLRGAGDQPARVVLRHLDAGDDAALPRQSLGEVAEIPPRERQRVDGEDAAHVGDDRLHDLDSAARRARPPDGALAVRVDRAGVAWRRFRLGRRPEYRVAAGLDLLDLDAALLEPLQLALGLFGDRLFRGGRQLDEGLLP